MAREFQFRFKLGAEKRPRRVADLLHPVAKLLHLMVVRYGKENVARAYGLNGLGSLPFLRIDPRHRTDIGYPQV
jgi:hypothetical protein